MIADTTEIGPPMPFIVAPSGCYIWTGSIDRCGYGRIERHKPVRRSEQAHRAAYRAAYGEIPVGLVLDHLCRVRRCVNPQHLQPVTQRTNVLRGMGHIAFQIQKTHCPQGHPYDESNTLHAKPRGCRQTGRKCRTCVNARKRAAYARQAVSA